MTSINTGYKTSCPLKQAIYYIHPITLKPHPLYYYPESGPKKTVPKGPSLQKLVISVFFFPIMCCRESELSGDQFHNKMEVHCTIAGTVTLAGCQLPVFVAGMSVNGKSGKSESFKRLKILVRETLKL
jgi:hypothetical protein